MQKFDESKLSIMIGAIFGRKTYGIAIIYPEDNYSAEQCRILEITFDMTVPDLIKNLDQLKREIEMVWHENHTSICKHGKNQGD